MKTARRRFKISHDINLNYYRYFIFLFFQPVKGERGELQFYFWKIPLHQQKFLVVMVLS